MTDSETKKTLFFTFGYMREGLMLLVMAVLVFIIYSNILKAPFVFDDQQNIRDNPHVRLTELTLEGINKTVVENPYNNRPVAHASFVLNYYFHKYNVMGYHLVNILIHIMTGIFLYFFLKITLSISILSMSCRYPVPGKSQTVARDSHAGFSDPSLIAFFAVLIWLVHPIQTQSVTYIVQRMNSMAAMFYVLSFLLYAKARLAEEKKKKSILFAGCVLAGILALGSKEIAATLPFFIFLYEWYFFQDLNRDWFKRHIFLFSGVVILFAIVAVVYMGAHPLERILSDYDKRSFTLTQRVLTEFRVVIYYISLLIFPLPSRLNLDHDFAVSSSLINPATTIFSIVSVIGLIGLAFYMAKRERLLSFCILWFLGNLVIESSVIGLEIAFEHRTYLPSMLVSMMVVVLVCRYVRQRWVILSLLCVVMLVFSYWTYERNKVWGSELSLWEDCVKKSPGKARPHNNLGVALADQDKSDEAVEHYSKALQIKSNYVEAHYNLGNILVRQGRIPEAIDNYAEALKINPRYAKAHYNLGTALVRQGRVDEAIDHYSEALRINPDYAKAHYNLGNALARQGRVDEAIDHYSEALRINPDDAQTLANLKAVSAVLKETDIAIKRLRKSIEADPGNPELYYELGNLYYRKGKLDDAIYHYQKSLSIQPDVVQVLNNLAIVYMTKKEYDRAVSILGRIAELQPDNADIYYNIACMYSIQNKVEKSIDSLKKAIEKGYDNWNLITVSYTHLTLPTKRIV